MMNFNDEIFTITEFKTANLMKLNNFRTKKPQHLSRLFKYYKLCFKLF